jgi:glutamate--cysteine ligase
MTALLSAPLKDLEQRIVGAFADIEAWLREAFIQNPPVFYSSVDLRNNGQKIVSVDTNVFPGGFNNLPLASYPLAAEALRRQVGRLERCDSVLLIPENHTRNLAYLDNVVVLKHLFESAGINVQLGRLDGETLTLVSQSGASVSMLPVEREGGLLRCGNVTPCVVVLNNDLSAGLPPMLRDLSVPIMPPLKMGWITRRKSAHFHQYRRAAEELAALLNADAWLLSADFSVCHKVDFQRREGMECLAVSVEETLRQISEKYRQHGVTDEPFVVLKADAGTYGMGIMSVRHADEVFNLNRRQRNKMSVGKEGAVVRDVLIQEGVNTLDDVGSAPAEPVVYMVGE